MTYTNKLALPAAIVKRCSFEKHNKPGELSATTLLKGLKQIVLEERHWNEISQDVSDNVWALFGEATHSLLETESPDEFSEVSVDTEVEGVKITGRIDNYNMKSGVITDFKTASVWKIMFNDFSDWKKQGLLYAWLLRRNAFIADRCRFIALMKDHSKSKARYDANYPQSPVFVFEFQVTPADLRRIEDMVIAKSVDYKASSEKSDDAIPACSPEERWYKPGKVALMKSGRKSAIKLYNTKEEAEAAQTPGTFIEERPGESKRCADYCLVNKWCDFYKNNTEVKE